ncbi:MAG: hypothetical protein OXK80_00815 [Bdellovibrionales bacterium]|nr:hypothetical protein [Bdellovibrionales bacterium]
MNKFKWIIALTCGLITNFVFADTDKPFDVECRILGASLENGQYILKISSSLTDSAYSDLIDLFNSSNTLSGAFRDVECRIIDERLGNDQQIEISTLLSELSYYDFFNVLGLKSKPDSSSI